MGKRRGKSRRPERKKERGSGRAGARTLGVRRSASGGWVFVHPRCVRERADDLDEVREMIRAGEREIAVDELRWLLTGCSDYLEAHQLLGELALELDNNVELARGHFGIAFQLGEKALHRAGDPRPLPYGEPANRPFFECGRQLAACLAELGKRDMAQSVLEQLISCDPSDPLQLKSALDDLKSGGLPIVEL
jgi:hypothetical protein